MEMKIVHKVSNNFSVAYVSHPILNLAHDLQLLNGYIYPRKGMNTVFLRTGQVQHDRQFIGQVESHYREKLLWLLLTKFIKLMSW